MLLLLGVGTGNSPVTTPAVVMRLMDAVLSFSIRHRWLVMLFVLGLVGLGVWKFTNLPIDAVPDITNVQVQIITPCPSLGPIDVEMYGLLYARTL